MIEQILTLFLLLVTFSVSMEIIFFRWHNQQPLPTIAVRHLRFWITGATTALTVLFSLAVLMVTFTKNLANSIKERLKRR